MVTKQEFADFWKRSLRWVDDLLAETPPLPHIKFSDNNGRVRIPLNEANAWVRKKMEKYQRRGHQVGGNLPNQQPTEAA
jgi:hypothetical protein